VFQHQSIVIFTDLKEKEIHYWEAIAARSAGISSKCLEHAMATKDTITMSNIN